MVASNIRKAQDLPQVIPVFPLEGVLLLPHGMLPLNIFEPRYLNMVDDAMAGERIIGMVQALPGGDRERPSLASIGCAGKITSFAETSDGRYLITLTGLCRFDLVREVPAVGGYRRVLADFAPYAADLATASEISIDRDRLVNALRAYFIQRDIAVDWDAIAETPDEGLVTSLAMLCPFEPNEKQALLQSPDLTERGRVLTALIEMALLGNDAGDAARHWRGG